MIEGKITSYKTEPDYKHKNSDINKVRKIVLDLNQVPDEFKINPDKKISPKKVIKQINRESIILNNELDRWKYLKGSKNESRYNKAGDFYYKYAEGAMAFPDSLDKPSRTIITGEGGASPSRFKHVIKQNGIYRRLTPLEY